MLTLYDATRSLWRSAYLAANNHTNNKVIGAYADIVAFEATDSEASQCQS